MFCEWCCRFDKNEHRNQFVKGYSSMNSQGSTKMCKHLYNFGVIEFVYEKLMFGLWQSKFRWLLNLEMMGHHWQPIMYS